MNHIEFGKLGEEQACEYLEDLDYLILAKNYRLKSGEIDIIARKNNTISFIEVKTRRNNKFGAPSESVDYKRQARLKNTAKQFIGKYFINLKNIKEYSFDVIEIIYKNKKFSINHIKNAF